MFNRLGAQNSSGGSPLAKQRNEASLRLNAEFQSSSSRRHMASSSSSDALRSFEAQKQQQQKKQSSHQRTGAKTLFARTAQAHLSSQGITSSAYRHFFTLGRTFFNFLYPCISLFLFSSTSLH
jgi:hypothetical protein